MYFLQNNLQQYSYKKSIPIIEPNYSKVVSGIPINISTNISNETVIKYFNKLNVLININMQKSINWCKKHQFVINKEFIYK